MATDFSAFWCCLPDGEKALLQAMGLFVPDPDPEMLKVGWDAIWAFWWDSPGSEWYQLWMDIWSMSIQEREIEPGLFEEVIVWNLGDWLAFGLFSLTPAFACSDPCRYTSGIFSLPP